MATVGLKIQDRSKQLPMFVMKSGQYPIALQLRLVWLHDVAAPFASNTINFG
jgi:hypothetical protein